jgi:hypothetical protein
MDKKNSKEDVVLNEIAKILNNALLRYIALPAVAKS